MKKIGKIVGNVLITIILVFSILMTVMVLSSTKHESGLPNLFGKAIFNVLTDSMMSEEGFPEGSLIIVELTDTKSKEPYKVGDVVTFWRYYEDQKYLETHRIVADTYTSLQNEVVDGVWIHGGEPYYVTRGDNTPDIDYTQNLEVDYASNGSIVAKWTGIAIPHLGSILSFLQSQLGFMLCVVIPTAIFFFFELFKFISTLMDAKKEKAVAAVKDAEEEIKQRVMAEMLAAQGAAVPAEAVKAAEEKPKPVEETQKPEESEEDIKKKAVEEYIAKQEAEKAAAAKAAEEEEIKRKAVEEYIKQQEAEKAAAEQAAKEEELKKQAIAEYLAQQEAEKADAETTEE